LIVLPGYGCSREKTPIEIDVLDVEGLIQMKRLSKSLHNLRRKFGIQRIHLARLSGGQMNDKKRDHRDKEKGDHFLYEATTDEG
jgi:hypothetical protein